MWRGKDTGPEPSWTKKTACQAQGTGELFPVPSASSTSRDESGEEHTESVKRTKNRALMQLSKAEQMSASCSQAGGSRHRPPPPGCGPSRPWDRKYIASSDLFCPSASQPRPRGHSVTTLLFSFHIRDPPVGTTPTPVSLRPPHGHGDHTQPSLTFWEGATVCWVEWTGRPHCGRVDTAIARV